jgi:hypothetical protein
MNLTNDIALKEWAVICEALASGRQQILFRTGGIHEGLEGFRPQHQEFWLYPTGFHQSLDGIRTDFRSEFDVVGDSSQPEGSIPIRHYASIQGVYRVEDEALLERLRPFHVQSDEAILTRFHYRKPGLFVLVVQVGSLPEPVSIPHHPDYDGCHSWVMLKQSIPTTGLADFEETPDVTTRIADLLYA